MPTAIAQNENDQVTADAYRASILGDTLKLWGLTSNPASSETIAYAGISGIVDAAVFSNSPPTVGAVAPVNVGGVGDTFGFTLNNFQLLNTSGGTKTVYAVLLVSVTKSKALYLLKFDAPLTIPAGGNTILNMTLYFNTSPYS